MLNGAALVGWRCFQTPIKQYTMAIDKDYTRTWIKAFMQKDAKGSVPERRAQALAAFQSEVLEPAGHELDFELDELDDEFDDLAAFDDAD